MDLEDKRVLFDSSLLRVEKVRCQRARRGLSCEECKTEHQIAVPLSGVNVHHLADRTYAVSPTHVTLSNRGDPYRVSHPYGSGETQLTLVLKETALFELLAERDAHVMDRDRPFLRHQLPIEPKMRFALQLLLSAARQKTCSELEFEEAALQLLERMLRGLAMPTKSALTRRDHALAQNAASLIASRHTQALKLDDIASALGVSVYHLCRVYRRVTEKTLWSEIQRLRTREALIRLEYGECDLTNLGVSLGYSHHSHFTASFRREIGVTPSAARRLLRTGSVTQLRRLIDGSHP